MVSALALQGSKIQDVDIKELIEQIESKLKSKNKLPTWFKSAAIYYPNKLNIEQTSSESTAQYKTSLIEGDTIIDLTGGFGVDCFYFAKRFESVFHCEINEDLSKMAAYNFRTLETNNIETIPEDGLHYLKSQNKSFDWIYVDPSRRHDSKGKVVFLKDCLPNIPQHLELLFQHSNNILIKTSPLLDLTVGINELNNVKEIHIVALDNEVKELLWILEKNYSDDILVKSINIRSDNNQYFTFYFNEESDANIEFSPPLAYLYEPNAAILKAGAFNSVAKKLQLSKLHKHSHLYTSDALIEFPGRRFQVLKSLHYHKKTLKQIGISKANITTRNFPETVQQLRKKHNIKDGGDHYLFFTTDLYEQKIALICIKVE